MVGREGKVLQFRPRPTEETTASPFRRQNMEPERTLILPPRVISFGEASVEMSRIFREPPTPLALADLHFPPQMNFRIIPNGVEFCDKYSKRPVVYSETESAGDVAAWTRCWHLSMAREGGFVRARFVDKSYLGKEYGPAECLLKIGKHGPDINELISAVHGSCQSLATVRMLKP